MTPWLLFGAGGKSVSARTLELALAGQRPVVAVIRHADATTKLAQQGIQAFTDDTCDASVVAAACRTTDPDAFIISTVGGAQDYLAHRIVIDETEKVGINRMILVTSLGCGDSWSFLSERAEAAFGQAVREKTLAESWLQVSQLDYAILRPDGLLDGTATGKARRIQDQECHGFVNRADVAAHIHELTDTSMFNQQVYSLIEPDLKPAWFPSAACPCRSVVTESCVLKSSLSPARVFTRLSLLLLALVLFGASQGVLRISFDAPFDKEYRDIWLNIHLSRALLAVLAGAALATARTIVRGLFHNPMADPGLLGVSSGSALMVSVAIVLPFSFPVVLVLYEQMVFAIAGDLVVCIIIFLITQRHRDGSMMQLLLVGIAIDALCGTTIGILSYIGDEQQLRRLILWVMGNLGQAQWPTLLVANSFIPPAIIATAYLAGTPNSLQLGGEGAHYLGVNVRRKRQ